MEWQRVEHAPSSGGQRANVLARTFARLDTLGRDDVLAGARAYYLRSQELRRARVDMPDRYAADREAVLTDLVTGSVTPEQATEAMADLARAADQQGAIPALLRDASTRAVDMAWESIRSHADRLVSDLGPMVEGLVRDSVAAAELIPDHVTDEASAMGEGAEVAGAWARCRELAQTWHTVHDLTDELRLSGALPTADAGTWPEYLHPGDYRYRHPERVDTAHFRRSVPDPLILAAAAAAGAKPSIYTAQNVRAHRAANGSAAAA